MRTKQIVSIIGLGAFALLALTTISNWYLAIGNLQFFAHSATWLSAIGDWLSPFTASLILAAAPLAIPVDDLNGVVGDIKDKLSDLENLSGRFKGLEDDNAQLRKQLGEVRRGIATRALGQQRRCAPGFVSDDCARHIAGIALAARLRSGKQIENADLLHGLAKDILGIEIRSALTSSDIPLPTEYSGEVVELVSQYAATRKYGTVYPLGAGTVKLPQLKTDPAFGVISQSATISEKSPQTAWVTFAVEKYGGLIRIPSEMDADSVVALGQFIARYAARQIAKIEDLVFFTNDGSTYGAVEGLTKSVITNSKVSQMASTKTHYSDATLANLRTLRSVVDAAAIMTGGYYMHPSFEQFLSGLNTAGDKPYQANASQGASLDGFPIRWVDVLPAYSTSANVSKVFILFGDLSFQYLGVRGGVRFDTSVDAAFATDEILIRALERFTIGLMAVGAVAGLETAAS